MLRLLSPSPTDVTVVDIVPDHLLAFDGEDMRAHGRYPLRSLDGPLEINYERCNEQQATDNTKPKQAIEEVWIDAQHGTGNHCGDFALPLPVNKIGHSKHACDKSGNEIIHVSLSECPHKRPEPNQRLYPVYKTANIDRVLLDKKWSCLLLFFS